MTGQTEATVHKGLRELVAQGRLETFGHCGLRNRTFVYRLRVNAHENTGIEDDREPTNLQLNPPKNAVCLLKVEGIEIRERARKRATPRAFASQDKGEAVTLAEYRATLKERGEKLIPADDEIYIYCVNAGIDFEKLEVALDCFDNRFLVDEPTTRYANWRGMFRRSVRDSERWFRLWNTDEMGAVTWTSTGRQARQAMHNARRRAEQRPHEAPEQPREGPDPPNRAATPQEAPATPERGADESFRKLRNRLSDHQPRSTSQPSTGPTP